MSKPSAHRSQPIRRGNSQPIHQGKLLLLFTEVVKGGSPDDLGKLLDTGLDVNEAFLDGGWSLLHCCAAAGRPDLCQVLFDNWVDIEAVSSPDTGKKSVADVALNNGHTELADTLIGKGSKAARPAVDTSDDVLTKAAYSGDNKRVRWALKNGADIKAFDKNGRSALHYAAEQGRLSTVQLLVRAGADVNAFDTDTHQNPMLLADKSGHENVFNYLKRKGSLISPQAIGIRASIRAARQATCPIALPAGAQALRQCALNRKRSAVRDLKALLKAGVSPNAANKRGETALMEACRTNNRKAADALLAAGADLHLRDKMGRSAYDHARDHKNRLLARHVDRQMRVPMQKAKLYSPPSRSEIATDVDKSVPSAYQPPEETVEKVLETTAAKDDAPAREAEDKAAPAPVAAKPVSQPAQPAKELNFNDGW